MQALLIRLRWLLALLVVAASCDLAQAAEEQKECYSITSPPAVAGGQGNLSVYGFGAISGSILLNRCTGQSWILVRTALEKGAASYRWYPIATGPGEAQLPSQP